MTTSEERFVECDICGERYEGEYFIRNYLKPLNHHLDNGETEILTICIDHTPQEILAYVRGRRKSNV